ncbi:MAG: hypothetical protein DMG38_01005 [Acidobacteria bacterium]|nr:MAG: hypothetical protein DMG38_01005 [Acidobacteriota bacterium]
MRCSGAADFQSAFMDLNNRSRRSFLKGSAVATAGYLIGSPPVRRFTSGFDYRHRRWCVRRLVSAAAPAKGGEGHTA